MRAHVIVNRRARHFESRGRLFEVVTRSRPDIRVVETYSLADLESVAQALASTKDVDAVIIAGGDGSYMAGVTALTRAFGESPLPAIGLAPGGTVSTVARNWGFRGDRTRYAERLLDRVATSRATTRRRPTLRVVADEVGDHIGFIVGSGLVARFFEVYEAEGARGELAALPIVARVFGGSFVGARFARSILEPVRCRIDVDDQGAPFDRVSLVCASVVRNLGLGMRLLYRAGEELHRFHVVGTALSPRALGPQLPLVALGRPLLGTRVDALATKLTIRFPEAPGAYVLDGDLFHARNVDVTAGPVLDILGP